LDPADSVGSEAAGINDLGVIVGGFIDPTGHTHAFSCHSRR
jgi:hypothetical protein